MSEVRVESDSMGTIEVPSITIGARKPSGAFTTSRLDTRRCHRR